MSEYSASNMLSVDTWNRIRIVLNVLAFFFAAPEFIGEQRLKKLKVSLSVGIQNTLGPLFAFSVVAFGLYVVVVDMSVVTLVRNFIAVFRGTSSKAVLISPGSTLLRQGLETLR